MSGTVRVFDDPASLAEAYCGELAASIKRTPAFSIALSGGNTPRLLFETLARRYAQLPWRGVHFFWGDERCVAPDHADSNFRMAKEALFDHIEIPSGNLHRIHGENDPVTEAARYGVELPRLDLVMLGLGEDGHTASIFPNNITLMESSAACEVSTHPASGQKRITVTGTVLRHARSVDFIVTGINKALKVAEILEARDGCRAYPAWRVQAMRDDVRWYLDEEAASLLGTRLSKVDR